MRLWIVSHDRTGSLRPRSPDLQAVRVMSAGTDTDFAAIIEPVARHLLGEPNKALSSKTQLRFGSRGSLSVEIGGKTQGHVVRP